MKTNELTGAALDWAVAKCEGHDVEDETWWVDFGNDCCYSTDWAVGGPIIERESMASHMEAPGEWHALQWWDDEDGAGYILMKGPTPLIAAMRCYVASKLGDEIEIPEEIK
jgi:hypothetical protein